MIHCVIYFQFELIFTWLYLLFHVRPVSYYSVMSLPVWFQMQLGGVVLLPVVSAGQRRGASRRWGDLPAWSAETAEFQTLLWLPECGRRKTPALLVRTWDAHLTLHSDVTVSTVTCSGGKADVIKCFYELFDFHASTRPSLRQLSFSLFSGSWSPRRTRPPTRWCCGWMAAPAAALWTDCWPNTDPSW